MKNFTTEKLTGIFLVLNKKMSQKNETFNLFFAGVRKLIGVVVHTDTNTL